MADLTPSYEADLFAALSMANVLPTPESLPAPEHQQPEPQHEPQPPPEPGPGTGRTNTPHPVPDEAPKSSSVPMSERDHSPRSVLVPETAAVPDRPTAQDHEAQSTADLLASFNAAMAQSSALSVSTPAPEPTPPRSPKRLRSPDLAELGPNSSKRIKTEDATNSVQGQEGANFDLGGDMGAMLKNALSSFDAQFQTPDAQLAAASVEQPASQSPVTAMPAPEKVGHKIMKASSNSTYFMRSMSLPVLGNVAVQLLVRLSQQSRRETELLLSETESDFHQAYQILRDVFGLARKVFSEAPLLFPDELEITDSEDRETIRMSNLATIALRIFGSRDVTLSDIHDSFFSIFVQEDGEYQDRLTALLISLKTRLFVDSLSGQVDPQQILDLLNRLFSANIDQELKRRSGDVALNPDEEGLVGQVNERRELLARCITDEQFRKSLATKFLAEEFAENLSTFLQSHLGIVIEYAEKYGVNIPLSEDFVETGLPGHNQQDAELAALLESEATHQTSGSKEMQTGDLMADNSMSLPLDLEKLLEQSLQSVPPQSLPELKDGLPASGLHDSDDPSAGLDAQELEALLSERLRENLDGPPSGLPSLTSDLAHNGHEQNNGLHPEYAAHIGQSHASHYASYNQTPASATPADVNGEPLPPNQSSPSCILYEKARQAAAAKSTNNARREGLTSTRRPWTQDEEKALMTGLDLVKGPHWSQILQLYGPNGTISDILKDRTQVQLKDKARNLKLFFLKTNSEMPYYLFQVTGELKTRAPSQAARKEAEEKARSEEEQARIQGIMTLAGGLQNNHHSSPLAGSPARPSPIAPAVRGMGTNGNTAATHGSTHSVPAIAPMPLSPMVKIEPTDHHPISHGNSLPNIQPAPAPPAQPVLKPHPSPSHHSPHQQHQHNQQQHHQVQQQAPVQPLQHAQPQQHQPHQPHQPQSQQQHQAPQAQISHSHTPQQILPAPPAQHQSQPQPSTQVSANQPLPPFTLPPPPNHHSTPDDHQDTKLFEHLKAALAAATTPAAVSEPRAAEDRSQPHGR